MDRRHRVDDRFTGPRAGLRGEQLLGGVPVTNDKTVHEVHHVERFGIDRRIAAIPEGGGDGNRGPAQSVNDTELATHVVGTGEDMAQRWSTQHEPTTVRVGHGKCEVRVAACDDRVGERSARVGNVRLQPLSDGFDVDSRDGVPGWIGAHVTYGSGLVRALGRRSRSGCSVHPSGIVGGMAGTSIIDVTDATFENDVIELSMTTPVVVDLWAPWCGPCKSLTPVLEKVVGATQGRVVLAKVNIDENPGIAQAFRVQSIPMVVAIRNGAPVTAFQGAQPEQVVEQFVKELLPSEREQEVAALLARGDEDSLRAVLEIEPGNEPAVVGLATLLTARGEGAEALALLGRVPETDDVRKAAAAARLSMRAPDDFDQQLETLLDVVKADDIARQQFLDILEVMGPDDPRTAQWRKKLTARLY